MANHIWLFQCLVINGIKQDETGFKLNLNDGRHKFFAHMHNTQVFSHLITRTQTAVKPPEIVSHLLSLRVDKFHNFWQAWKTLCLQISYLKDLVEIWHNFPFRWETKTQAQRGCCADCCTNWPSSQRQRSLALSTSNSSPWPQQQSSKPQRLHGTEPRRVTERSEKQTWVYRCSEITSYL